MIIRSDPAKVWGHSSYTYFVARLSSNAYNLLHANDDGDGGDDLHEHEYDQELPRK